MVHTEILRKELKRYTIKDKLGTGGTATVYRAVDNNLQREVAIKVLHEHLVHDKTFKERFEQEARLIAALNHPNIVQVYDFDSVCVGEDDIFYMVIPYLSGKTLVDVLNDCRIREETLPHDQILSIIGDLASALDYAHERGMVHRDVKPANVLFDENNKPILTDFGIARLAASSNITMDGNIVGTPAYMSPEQVTGQPIDSSSDIYALGIILFELLTGRTPFRDDNTMSLLMKHAQQMPPEVSEFTEMDNTALDRVLNKALAKLPEARYQTAQALVDALDKAFNVETTTERMKPRTIPTRPETMMLEKPKRNTLNTTFDTMVLRPAKQNPFGVIAVVIAVIALLFAARVMQSSPAAPMPTEEVVVNSMVVDEFYFTSEFEAGEDAIEYWQVSSSPSEQRTIEDGTYNLVNTRAGTAMNALFEPSFEYTDATITMTGRLLDNSADPNSAFGIVFRYLSPNDYNVFAVDGMGRYSIWVREDGTWRELRDESEDWTRNEIINPIGAINSLMVTTDNNVVSAYVNGEFVTMVEDDTFELGGVGVYLASTRNGEAMAEIKNFMVTPATIADSMTGEEDAVDSMTGEEEEVDSMTGESDDDSSN